jgi:predicted AAA+ superfamily ATPase
MGGALFENTVACLLYRGLWPEISGFLPLFKLGFYRDYQQHEVDFVLRNKKSIPIAIECKSKAKHGIGSLSYFEKHFNPTESLLVVEEENIFEINGKTTTVSIEVFASCLE